MTEILAQVDNGVLRPIRRQDRDELARLAGKRMVWSGRIPRNINRHRLFFAAISAAFEAWPAGHEFQPIDEDHLRGWLLCEAGYCDTMTVPVKAGHEDRAKAAMAAAMLFAGARAVFADVTRPRCLILRRPRSMRFDRMSEAQMRPVMTAVMDIIGAVGIDVAALLDEAGR